MELFPHGKLFDFMKYRVYFVGLSIVTCIAAVALLVAGKGRLGTDFRGGTEVEVAFNGPVTADQVRSAVTHAGFGLPEVVEISDLKHPAHFMIRVEEVSTISEAKRGEIEQALCFGDKLPAERCPDERLATEVRFSPGGDKITLRTKGEPDLAWIRTQAAAVSGIALREGTNNPSIQSARDHKVEIQLKSRGDQIMDGLRADVGAENVPDQALRVEWIGPKAGAQLRDSAVRSVLVSIVFIMVYVAFRFDIRFAPGTVVALLHDALGTLAVLMLLNKEITLSTIAALLTIIGYSVNDTVVVYDRVRETLPKLRGATFAHVINVSTSEVLGRTVLTSATTLISLLAFFVWGTGTLKEFALTLVIGILFGTYSSIYIALPLTEYLDTRLFAKGANKSKVKRPVRRASPAV